MISMSNIIVDKVNLKFNNELSYNDMPTSVNVEISCGQGRNMGGQEIYRCFNNQYVRFYKAPSSSGTTSINTAKNKDADSNNSTVRTNDTIQRDNQPSTQMDTHSQRTQIKEVPENTDNIPRDSRQSTMEQIESDLLMKQMGR